MSDMKFGEDWTKKVDFLCLFIIISFPSYERPPWGQPLRMNSFWWGPIGDVTS